MVERVALLDAGAQPEKVIVRRVLEQGYKVDKFPVGVSVSELRGYKAIIISGGPRSVTDNGAVLPDPDIYSIGIPIFGICYGMQAIAHQLRGKVSRGEIGQYGRNIVDVLKGDNIFYGLDKKERVLMNHFDVVSEVPQGFEVYARSEGLIAAMGNSGRKIFATQFHPELLPMTRKGDIMFENFFRRVCGFSKVKKRSIIDEISSAKNKIRETVGSDGVVMHYLSGGVDSSVMALLLKEYVEPDRLYMRTLDTGTMRSGEIEEVKRMAERLRLPNFEVLDVKKEFYSAIHDVELDGKSVKRGPLFSEIGPEIKRKLFGAKYAKIALDEMEKIASGKRVYLGQGTLRPDVIESGDSRASKGGAHTIKTHHNAVEALKNVPKVEPLIELFKDQVREIAINLGLEERFAYRQPFPGPGLYCRMIGTRGNVENDYNSVDERVCDAGRQVGLNAHALPIRTVGVQGDERSYKYSAIISGDLDWDIFEKFSLGLPNKVDTINRVLYTPGKPLKLEEASGLTPTYMDQEAIRQAREGDSVMREIAEEYGFNDSRRCSQMPGVLIPCNFGLDGKRSFVVRPVWTHDFMALIGMMPCKEETEIGDEYFPEEMFLRIAEEIPKRVEGISRVILDSSDKPPASTEWE